MSHTYFKLISSSDVIEKVKMHMCRKLEAPLANINKNETPKVVRKAFSLGEVSTQIVAVVTKLLIKLVFKNTFSRILL